LASSGEVHLRSLPGREAKQLPSARPRRKRVASGREAVWDFYAACATLDRHRVVTVVGRFGNGARLVASAIVGEVGDRAPPVRRPNGHETRRNRSNRVGWEEQSRRAAVQCGHVGVISAMRMAGQRSRPSRPPTTQHERRACQVHDQHGSRHWQPVRFGSIVRKVTGTNRRAGGT